MKKLVLPIIFVGIAYAAFPAAAAGDAGPKCSLNADELQGETLVIKNNGEYCETDSATRDAVKASLASYNRSIDPDVQREEESKRFAAEQAVFAKKMKSMSGKSTGKSDGSIQALVSTLYRQKCREAGMTGALCDSFIETQTNVILKKISEECGKTQSAAERNECEGVVYSMLQSMTGR